VEIADLRWMRELECLGGRMGWWIPLEIDRDVLIPCSLAHSWYQSAQNCRLHLMRPVTRLGRAICGGCGIKSGRSRQRLPTVKVAYEGLYGHVCM